MAISFAGLLEGQKGLAAEQAAAAKAQEDKEWRELIRQDSVDAKEQAQANFLRGIKDKRFTVLASTGTKYFNDRKPTEKMTQDLAFLNNLVGEVEGGSNWLDSLGKNPILISKAADAVRIAKEKNNYTVIGQDLVNNFKIIGASNNPDAALQEFANTGDLYSQFAEGDIQDDEFYFDFLARASAPVAASTSTYKIIDPKKLGMNQTTSEEYARQRTIWDDKTNDLLAESLRNLKKITDPDTDTQRKIDELGNAQLDAKAGDNAARDYLFGQDAWDILEEANRDQPQVFGSAFPRPPSGQSDGPAAPRPPMPTTEEELAALPRPTNAEERNNLPPGTYYIDPTGALKFFRGN